METADKRADNIANNLKTFKEECEVKICVENATGQNVRSEIFSQKIYDLEKVF